jgi:hypothetical protein
VATVENSGKRRGKVNKKEEFKLLLKPNYVGKTVIEAIRKWRLVYD